MTEEQLSHWFSYHAPEGDDLAKYAAIRKAAHDYANVVNANCPESADKTHAIRIIRDSAMWANSSVACKGR
jgi:hypothetical protein